MWGCRGGEGRGRAPRKICSVGKREARHSTDTRCESPRQVVQQRVSLRSAPEQREKRGLVCEQLEAGLESWVGGRRQGSVGIGGPPTRPSAPDPASVLETGPCGQREEPAGGG